MHYIIWNCRGSQSPDFRRNFRYLLDYHHPALVVLIERHISYHTAVMDDFQFTNMAQVPAEGSSGGIVVFWSRHLLTVEEVAMTHQKIHCIIQVTPLPNK